MAKVHRGGRAAHPEPVDLSLSKREMHARNLLMAKHYENMRNIQPTINSRPNPREQRRFQNFHKYKKFNSAKLNRGMEIKRANTQLIQKITEIATHASGKFHQKYPSKQRMFMTILAEHDRKLRQEKITKENQKLARRLLDKHSSYDQKKWAKDWEKHEKKVSHFSKAQQMGICRSRASSTTKSRSPSIRKMSTKSKSRKGSERLQKAGIEAMKNVTEPVLTEEDGDEALGEEKANSDAERTTKVAGDNLETEDNAAKLESEKQGNGEGLSSSQQLDEDVTEES